MTAALIILTVAVAIAYSMLVHRKVPDKKWDWWNTFAATFISVLAAFVVGLLLYEQQNRTGDAAQRDRLSNLLKAELSQNYRMLQGDPPMSVTVGSSTFPVYLSYVQPLVLEQVALSGLFDPLDCENFLHLAEKTRMYNVKAQYIFSLLAAGNTGAQYEQQMGHATRNLEETRQALLQDYDWLAKKQGFSIQWKKQDK